MVANGDCGIRSFKMTVSIECNKYVKLCKVHKKLFNSNNNKVKIMSTPPSHENANLSKEKSI